MKRKLFRLFMNETSRILLLYVFFFLLNKLRNITEQSSGVFSSLLAIFDGIFYIIQKLSLLCAEVRCFELVVQTYIWLVIIFCKTIVV